jgi:hypothetical protein
MVKPLLEKLKGKVQYLAIILLSILAGLSIYRVFDLTQTTAALMCNPNGYAIRIIDDSVTSEVRSIEAVNDPFFKSFITSLTDYISSKFSGATPCEGNSGEKPMINLIFVRLPLVTSGNDPIAPPPNLDTSLPNITCHLDSPWVKLAIGHSNSPLIQGVFIWNERQLLADQVLLSNQNLSLTAPLIPLSNHLFEQYATDYENSEMLRSISSENAQATISERIPADVLWLFRNSPQTNFIPFSSAARSAMNTTLERAAGGYANLVAALFEQCFSSTQNSEQRYKTILDLRNILSIDEYKIH